MNLSLRNFGKLSNKYCFSYYYRRYLTFAWIGRKEEKKMGRDEKSELKKLLNNTFAPVFVFFFFSSVHTRVQSAKCRKKKGRAWQWTSDRNIFDRDETWGRRERVDLRKDERGRDGGDEKCGGYIASYLEYELHLLNFITVRGANAHHVSRHTFTSNFLQLGRGREKVKQVFLTSRIHLATKLLLPRIFCRRINHRGTICFLDTWKKKR